MASASTSRSIDAPVAEVWSALADFGRIAVWAPSVDHSEVIPTGATGVGTTRRIQARRRVLLETIVSWEIETELSYSIAGLPPLLGGTTNTWNLIPAGPATRVTLTFDVASGPRVVVKPAATAVARRFGVINDGLLAGLDRHLRSEAA